MHASTLPPGQPDGLGDGGDGLGGTGPGGVGEGGPGGGPQYMIIQVPQHMTGMDQQQMLQNMLQKTIL